MQKTMQLKFQEQYKYGDKGPLQIYEGFNGPTQCNYFQMMKRSHVPRRANATFRFCAMKI